MRHGVRLIAVLNHEWLGVVQDGTSGGGVAHMSDGASAAETLQMVHAEHIGDKPHSLVGIDLFLFEDGDSGTLLASVLQGVETEIGHFGRLGMIMDGKQPAGFSRSFHFAHDNQLIPFLNFNIPGTLRQTGHLSGAPVTHSTAIPQYKLGSASGKRTCM
jgi:hypothetical protein